jgi:hypothetical protein
MDVIQCLNIDEKLVEHNCVSCVVGWNFKTSARASHHQRRCHTKMRFLAGME